LLVEPKHKTIVLTLDYSNSMNGNPFRCGRDAMCAVLPPLVTEFGDIVLLMYNHDITEFIVTKANVDSVINKISMWQACGATNFTKVFNRISQLLTARTIEHKGNVDFRVSFFTDGQHYTGDYGGHSTSRIKHDRKHAISIQEMYDSLSVMKKNLQSAKITDAGGNTTIVCRAYGGNNAVDVMNVITASGITAGDYQYASSPDGIKAIMYNDVVLTGDRMIAYIRFNSGNETVRTRVNLHTIDHNDDQKEMVYTHEGDLFVKSDTLVGATITIEIDNSKLPLDNTEIKVSGHEFAIISMKYGGEELRSVAADIVGMAASGAIIKTSVERLRALDKYMDKIWSYIQKVRIRMTRRNLAIQFKTMKDKIHEMNTQVADLSRHGRSSDRLSRLLHIGHAGAQITKRGLRNRLNKRVDGNADNIEAADAKIADIAASFDLDVWESKVPDNAPKCYVTLNNWPELVAAGDCMCISGFMARSETAIVAPHLIKFIDIYPVANCMSFGTFQDTLMVQLKDNTNHEDQVTGGFKFQVNHNHTEGVLTALHDQMINFVMPLYICKKHWKIAKLYIDRNFGWMATLDWAGADFLQIKTIPFVMLVKPISLFCTRKITESALQTFFNVARVAWQLKLDKNMKTIDEDFINWQKDASFRTADVIPDISVFLTKMLFLTKRPVLTEAFWLSVIEESSRRSMLSKLRASARANDDDSSAYSTSFLAEPHGYKEYVVMTELTCDTDNSFRNSMQAALSDAGISASAYTKAPSVLAQKTQDTPVFNSAMYNLTHDMMKPVIDNETYLQPNMAYIAVIKAMYDYMINVDMKVLYAKLDANFGIIGPDHMTAFAGLDLTSCKKDRYHFTSFFAPDMQAVNVNKQLYAMFLQNNSHTQHKKRRESVENKTYVDPFTDDSHVLVQKLVDSAVQSETGRQMTYLNSHINAQYGDLFKTTDDILTAAGIIHNKCKNVGDQSFIYLYETLQDDFDTPLHMKKIRLLVEGEHLGVRLYSDNAICHGVNNPFKWAASRKNMYKIMLAHQSIVERAGEKYSMTKDNWLQVFRWKETAGGKLTLRAPGEFPPNRNKHRNSKR
jgi:hypothetical protein